MTDPPSRGNDDPAAPASSPWFSGDAGLDVRQLMDLVPDYAVSMLDPDGRVATWSDGMRQLTWYEREDVLGAHYRTFFPEPVREAGRPDQLLEQARVDGRAEDQGWRLRGDGSRFWVREVVSPVREGDGSPEVGTGVGPDDARDDLAGYVQLLYDRTAEYERERELREEKAFTESLLAAQPDIVYAFDSSGNFLEWNDRIPELTGYTDDELAAMESLELVAPEHRGRIADAIGRVLEEDEYVVAEADILAKDGTRIPYEFNSARITGPDGAILGFTGVGRDVSERKARERELERLERLNATIRAIDETMVAAETCEEIETAVAEAFTAVEAYRFAVVGRIDTTVEPDSRAWETRSWAGVGAAGADEVLSSFAGPSDDGSDASPLETDAVQCYHHLRESEVDDRRADARERDYGSVAAVPITASGRTFGALVVAAAEPTAFADREREVLQEFGTTLGHAINAMAVRRLLYMDVVVELEFESTDRQNVCVDLSARIDCRLSVDHVLPLSDETFVYYVTVEGAEPERIQSLAEEHATITDVRRIAASNGRSHWEFVATGPTVAGLLADYGARMRSQVVDAGVSRSVVQVSPDVDVHELVDAVETAYPDTRLVSKRSVEQSGDTRGEFRRRVRDVLTDKQQAALEAAYHGGYFEWPRRHSDAGEIADRLGIARQTFHQHLRVAQGKLLAAYVGDGPGPED